MPRISLFLVLGLLAACSPVASQTISSDKLTAFDDIATLHAKVADGTLDYGQITKDALQRITELDDSTDGPQLNAIVEIDPHALSRAELLSSADQRPLAGIPFVVKANIDTAPPMRTHAGSLALAERVAANHAQLVTALENAGAVLVGKANLSEWANFRSSRSVSGWSSVGGQTKNPHVLDRNPCGSSSGSAAAVAAGLVPLAIGTETLGSIVCPAGVNGIVGVKPTLGLVSRDGIVPIAISQDTAGPMARSVRDAALALQVMAQPGRDDPYAQDPYAQDPYAQDPYAQDPYAKAHPGAVDFTSDLESLKLDGLRIGVWRAYSGAKDAPRVAAIFDRTLGFLEGGGAQLIDPVGLYLGRGIFDASYQVMLHEFNLGLQDYLEGTHTLTDIMAFNQSHADKVMPWFGQDILAAAEAGELSVEEHAAALDAGQGEMQRRLDEVFAKFQLDFIVAPTNGPAWPIDVVLGDRFGVSSSGLAAISGRPAITLPAGQIRGLPIGVSIVGKMWGDADLLAMAFALEKLLPQAPRPGFLPSLEN